MRCSHASAGSAGARSTTSAGGSRSRRPRRMASPRSTRCSRWSPSRPWSRTSAPTSPASHRGSQELVADLERRVAPEGAHPGNGQAVWHESPCLGLCERAPAALAIVAGEAPRERAVAPADVRRTSRACSPAVTRRPARAQRPAGRAIRRCACCGGSAWSTPTASTATVRTAATRRSARRSTWARIGVLREVSDSKLHGPRRRRVPDRAQVGGRRPQRRAPALPDLQRRRVRAGHVQGPRDPRERTRSSSSRR